MQAPADGAFYVDLLRNRVNPGVDALAMFSPHRTVAHSASARSQYQTPCVPSGDFVEVDDSSHVKANFLRARLREATCVDCVQNFADQI